MEDNYDSHGDRNNYIEYQRVLAAFVLKCHRHSADQLRRPLLREYSDSNDPPPSEAQLGAFSSSPLWKSFSEWLDVRDADRKERGFSSRDFDVLVGAAKTLISLQTQRSDQSPKTFRWRRKPPESAGTDDLHVLRRCKLFPDLKKLTPLQLSTPDDMGSLLEDYYQSGVRIPALERFLLGFFICAAANEASLATRTSYQRKKQRLIDDGTPAVIASVQAFFFRLTLHRVFWLIGVALWLNRPQHPFPEESQPAAEWFTWGLLLVAVITVYAVFSLLQRPFAMLQWSHNPLFGRVGDFGIFVPPELTTLRHMALWNRHLNLRMARELITRVACRGFNFPVVLLTVLDRSIAEGQHTY